MQNLTGIKVTADSSCWEIYWENYPAIEMANNRKRNPFSSSYADMHSLNPDQDMGQTTEQVHRRRRYWLAICLDINNRFLSSQK